MIVFGWNSYQLKSFHLSELGVFNRDLGDPKIEYRQKYAHLMFIPIFPIGRFWALRVGGKLYHPSPDLQARLNTTAVQTKQGIWAWSGALATLLIFVVVGTYGSLENGRIKQNRKESKMLMSTMLKTNPDIEPTINKIELIDSIAGSIASLPLPAQKKLDTSKIMSIALSAMDSKTDSIEGIDETNNLVLTSFRKMYSYSTNSWYNEDYLQTLKTRNESSSYADTAAMQNFMRKVKNYHYVTVIKEYNRADPTLLDDSHFSEGILLSDVFVVELSTGKTIATFKDLASSSENVSTIRSSYSTDGDFSAQLQHDLERSAVKSVVQYLYKNKSSAGEDLSYYPTKHVNKNVSSDLDMDTRQEKQSLEPVVVQSHSGKKKSSN